jgi:hypothetical protein
MGLRQQPVLLSAACQTVTGSNFDQKNSARETHNRKQQHMIEQAISIPVNKP